MRNRGRGGKGVREREKTEKHRRGMGRGRGGGGGGAGRGHQLSRSWGCEAGSPAGGWPGPQPKVGVPFLPQLPLSSSPSSSFFLLSTAPTQFQLTLDLLCVPLEWMTGLEGGTAQGWIISSISLGWRCAQ